MPLSPFTVNGKANHHAAYEWIIINSCIYMERDVYRELWRMLAGYDPPRVKRFHIRKTLDNDPTSEAPIEDKVAAWTEAWTPGHLFIEDGTTVWAAIEGTYNATQWTTHFTGYVRAYDFLDGTTLVHQGMWWAARNLYAELKTFVGSQPGLKNYRLSGHSMGGAVAWLIGVQLKHDYPEANVEVMSFGAPRVLTSGYKGPYPDKTHLYVHGKDRVPTLPPGVDFEPRLAVGGAVATTLIPLPFFWMTKGWSERTPYWQHYYDTFTHFTYDGDFSERWPDDYNNVSNTTEYYEAFLDHRWQRYTNGLYYGVNQFGAHPRRDDLWAVYSRAALNFPGLWWAEELTRFAPQPDALEKLYLADQGVTPDDLVLAQSVSVVADLTVPFNITPPGATGMADTSIWKITCDFEVGPHSWSEHYHMGGRPAIPDAYDARVTKFLELRGALLSQEVRFGDISVSILGDPNRTEPRPAGSWGGQQSFSAASPRFVQTSSALMVRLSGQDGLTRSTIYVRGFDETAYPAGADTNPRLGVTASADAAMQRFLQYLQNKSVDGLIGNFVIPSKARTLAGVQTFPVDDIIKAPGTPYWQVKALGWVPTEGQKIRLAGVRGWGVKGINKGHTVQRIETTGHAVLSGRACDDCPVDLHRFGNVIVPLKDATAVNVINAQTAGWTIRRLGSSGNYQKKNRGRSCCN